MCARCTAAPHAAEVGCPELEVIDIAPQHLGRKDPGPKDLGPKDLGPKDLGLKDLRLVDLGLEFAVLFIDLDRFKVVNDTLGHRVGDLLLLEFATRLRAALQPADVLAHSVVTSSPSS